MSNVLKSLLMLLCCSGLACQKSDPPQNSNENTENQSETENETTKMPLSIQQEPFGEVDDQQVTLFHLVNENGLQVSVMNYGATVTAVKVPDKDGNIENITIGYDNFDDYLEKNRFFGSTVGRYANRIAKGKFSLNGKEYQLATNNGENHLHGGEQGFDKRVWIPEEVKTEDSVGVKLTYLSPDGEEGYPGEVQVTVVYSLTNDNELKMEFTAVPKADTILNLANHAYWNLGTVAKGTVLDQVLMLNCDKYLPVDETLIPTGELAPVEDTVMSFQEPTAIGERIDQLKTDNPNGGYDHCYVINNKPGEFVLAARVTDPKSGRVMEVHSDQPGIQFYSGNFLGPEGPGGFDQHAGFCLETQHFPDSPNQDWFPGTVVKAGQVWKSTTIHKFSVEGENQEANSEQKE